ncbi:MAG TPA: SIMPL domain-containing protein, partial [Candidatus Saccharimonadales bacterium]|nr:SIMPL domain-containing protein [Candidatus Saccharimonadales bacterium]
AMRQFSDARQRELENQARDKAVQDARTKAERTAKDLNASLGNVLEVKDTARFGGIPIARDGVGTTESTTNLPVTPGKNSVTFSVDVVFELR